MTMIEPSTKHTTVKGHVAMISGLSYMGYAPKTTAMGAAQTNHPMNHPTKQDMSDMIDNQSQQGIRSAFNGYKYETDTGFEL